MPNGVICGGGVDGSNQLGAIVTWHAMAARPGGAGLPASARLAESATTAPSSRHAKARIRHDRMMSSSSVLLESHLFERRCMAGISLNYIASTAERDRAQLRGVPVFRARARR